jgi:hypothetical protein
VPRLRRHLGTEWLTRPRWRGAGMSRLHPSRSPLKVPLTASRLTRHRTHARVTGIYGVSGSGKTTLSRRSPACAGAPADSSAAEASHGSQHGGAAPAAQHRGIGNVPSHLTSAYGRARNLLAGCGPRDGQGRRCPPHFR